MNIEIKPIHFPRLQTVAGGKNLFGEIMIWNCGCFFEALEELRKRNKHISESAVTSNLHFPLTGFAFLFHSVCKSTLGGHSNAPTNITVQKEM